MMWKTCYRVHVPSFPEWSTCCFVGKPWGNQEEVVLRYSESQAKNKLALTYKFLTWLLSFLSFLQLLLIILGNGWDKVLRTQNQMQAWVFPFGSSELRWKLSPSWCIFFSSMINPFGNKVGYENIWLYVCLLTFFLPFLWSQIVPKCAIFFYLVEGRRFLFPLSLSREYKKIKLSPVKF